ncbi:hypothetical protein EsH8_IV_000799 [Colletotrichum jinshuiense]
MTAANDDVVDDEPVGNGRGDDRDGDRDGGEAKRGGAASSAASSSRADHNDDDDDVGPETRAFLARCGLRASAVGAAHAFAGAEFPGFEAAPAPFQGYCSYTLILRRRREPGDGGSGSGSGSGSTSSSGKSSTGSSGSGGDRSGRLVQFRPRRHGIDVGICAEAREVLGARIAPGVEALGALTGLETVGGGGDEGEGEGELRAYALERVGGVSLTEFRGLTSAAGPEQRRACRRRVVADLAVVFADSWRGRRAARDVARGRVGGSLGWRVRLMRDGLPGELGGAARAVAAEMRAIEGLPWVVTHGDLVPDNIMVHPPPSGEGGDRARRDRAGGVVGLIDWAEAEWLPFGVGMYGLEEVLGEDVPVPGGGDAAATGFEYYPEARELRNLFWDEVGRVVGDDEVIRRARRAQVLGVLLWRGIAFDDGLLGRVVDGERDPWDFQRLNAWLLGEGGLGCAASGRRSLWSRVWSRAGRCFRGDG